MSKRRLLVAEIKTRLQAAGFKVSRKLRALTDLRQDEFPFASITSGIEYDTAAEMKKCSAQWDLHIVLYVFANPTIANPLEAQDMLDDAMAAATKALVPTNGDIVDFTLGGLVDDFDCFSRDTDRGIYSPYGAADMVFRIKFDFDRITEGG